MIQIRISHETPEEKRVIMEALDIIMIPCSIKGYMGKKQFQRSYITGKLKEIKSEKG